MRKAIPQFLWLLVALLGAVFGSGIPVKAMDAGAPHTAKQDVTDKYYGIAVSDSYRWLENANDKKVHAWSLAQDARTRKYLDGLAVRKPIFTQLMKQISATA